LGCIHSGRGVFGECLSCQNKKTHQEWVEKNQFSPLHLAILASNNTQTFELIKSGTTDIYRLSYAGHPPLFTAVVENELQYVDALLAPFKTRRNPISKLYHGTLKKLKWRFDLFHKDIFGNNIIFLATARGQLGVIKKLLSIEPRLKYTTANQGQSLVECACINGKTDVALYLIYAEKDIKRLAKLYQQTNLHEDRTISLALTDRLNELHIARQIKLRNARYFKQKPIQFYTPKHKDIEANDPNVLSESRAIRGRAQKLYGRHP